MAKAHILIVEDDFILAEDLKKTLNNLGYAVSGIAASGEIAIDKIKEKLPDLVLMDIVLKGDMDGVDTAQIIHENYDVPVIFVTAYADEEKIERARLSAPYGFLLKPYRTRELTIAIDMGLYMAQVERNRKQSEEALRKKEAELAAQSEDLKEVNAALKVLLRQRDDDKKIFEENILNNLQKIIRPLLERLKQSRLTEDQAMLLSALESNLNDITSPFTNKLSSKYFDLTPMEIRVANLVKEGRMNQEIADILCLAKTTIMFHRANIRNKLGLKNSGQNLRSHLLTLSE